jgi:hypothetical protein
VTSCDGGRLLQACLDQMMSALRPRYEGNVKFLRSIEKSMASIRHLCLAQSPTAAAVAAAS